MRERLVVFGSGGHAKVVIEAALSQTPDCEIIVLDDSEEALGRRICGFSVSGRREQLTSLKGSRIVPAIGDNDARARFLLWLRENGHALASVIHPSAHVAKSVNIGAGAFVGAGAIVIAEARIGEAAIINTSASVDHDCEIGDAVHLGPGVKLCGNVRIGLRTLVGVGSCVRPGISICDDVVLGAGSVVVKDIKEPGTFAGNPARRLR